MKLDKRWHLCLLVVFACLMFVLPVSTAEEVEKLTGREFAQLVRGTKKSMGNPVNGSKIFMSTCIKCHGEDGKAINFKDDKNPKYIGTVTGIIVSHRGNILHVQHNRLAGNPPIGKTRVAFIIEIKGEKHLEQILSDFKTRGFEAKRIET